LKTDIEYYVLREKLLHVQPPERIRITEWLFLLLLFIGLIKKRRSQHSEKNPFPELSTLEGNESMDRE
jgi:hypothetical protein